MAKATIQDSLTISLSVSDRHKSADWYSEMLGFGVMFHADEAGWSEIMTKTPGVTIGLSEHGEPSPGSTTPVFGVGDINEARGNLEKAGVKFDGETMVIEGMVKLATFADPDGNVLMLAQDLSGQG
jgi:predicted enzyme related to lactoylglutathione lyase